MRKLYIVITIFTSALVSLLIWNGLTQSFIQEIQRLNNARGLGSNSVVNYTSIMEKMNKANVPPDDKLLVEVLRKHYIEPPSILPYNLEQPGVTDQSPKQAQIIDRLLKNKTGGFFVESGALDGEHLSNTLFFERFRKWNGVLIEPNPDSYKQLKNKNRKAYTLNACLSVEKHPSQVSFYTGRHPAFGKIINRDADISNKGPKYKRVQCFPLYSVLLAINHLTIDYFSLDVEGAELGVLDNLPWDRVDIKTMSIEHNKWRGGKKGLKAYMARRGYTMMQEIVGINVSPDLIFMKNDSLPV